MQIFHLNVSIEYEYQTIIFNEKKSIKHKQQEGTTNNNESK